MTEPNNKKNTNIFYMMQEYMKNQQGKKNKTEKNEEKLKYIPKNIFSFLLDYCLYNTNFNSPNKLEFVDTGQRLVKISYKDSLDQEIYPQDSNYSVNTAQKTLILNLKINKKLYFLTLDENCVIIQIDTNGESRSLKFSLEKSVHKIFYGYQLFISPSIQERINSLYSDLNGNSLFYNIFEKKFFIVFENMNLYINENKEKNSDELYYIIVGKNRIYFNHELYFKKISPMKKVKE